MLTVVFNEVYIISGFILECKKDLFRFAETWILPDVPESFIALNHYNIAGTDTLGDTRKHGVYILVCKKRHKFCCINVWAVQFSFF